MKKLCFSVALVFVICSFLGINICAQEWKEIEPLVSTCKEIKRIFKTQECDLPVSRYKGERFDTTVFFKQDTDNWNVSPDTVIWAQIILKEFVKLEDFEADLQGYKISPEEDLPNVNIYRNEKMGIQLTVQKLSNGELWISSISLFPSLEKKEKGKKRVSKTTRCPPITRKRS